MQLRPSLSQFISKVHESCLAELSHPRFCQDQESLLRDTVECFFRTAPPEDWNQPLGLFYCVYRICGDRQDELALLLARFCAFYVMSADLFDDVQDEDLRGKPHELAGSSIATNSALTLLTLALDALGEASSIEERPDRVLKYLRAFNRVSLVAVSAQHRDLMGDRAARTRSEVECLHRGKTSSLALVCECAALAGGADPAQADEFYALGEDLCAAVQVIDDVRDIVVKDESTDLMTGKWTYPLACFHDLVGGVERDQLAQLLAQRPLDLPAVCALLEETGAFHLCAAAVEDHRTRIFDRLEAAPFEGPHTRILLDMIDRLASVLYDPVPRSCTRASTPSTNVGISAVRAGRPLLSERVETAAVDFARRMSCWGFGPKIELTAWPHPIFLYSSAQGRVFYSDTEALPEETLPFHAALLDLSVAETKEWIERMEPFLIAHESTHAFRDRLGRLGEDAWHEEHIANELALAYVSAYDPACGHAVLWTSRRLLQLHRGDEASSKRRGTLAEEARHSGGTPRDYGLSARDAALVHAEMLVRFSSHPRRLDEIVREWVPLRDVTAAE